MIMSVEVAWRVGDRLDLRRKDGYCVHDLCSISWGPDVQISGLPQAISRTAPSISQALKRPSSLQS